MFHTFTLWLTLQEVWRPYEDSFASLQGWGQERHHHWIKLALGFNGVSLHLVPRLHPPPLCYLLPTGISRGVGKKLWDRHPFGWHTHHTGWTLQQCQGPRYLKPGAFPNANEWGDGVRLGVHLLRHLQILTALFLECFPLDHITELKCDCFYGGLPKWFKVIVAYLKASSNERTYSDYLWVAQEA